MYDFIRGHVEELTPAYVIIEAGGVGYHINISLQSFSSLEKLTEAKIYVHFIVREDAQIFYGFATKRERELFRLLIAVSGIGGGTARMILSTYTPEELTSIIATENVALLKNVKGLGTKSAQKIIVDLKDKITGIGSTEMLGAFAAANDKVYDEALSALTMLGFAKAASERVLREVIKSNPSDSVESIVRKSLGKL